MTTEHYHITKVVEHAKGWRATDKQKIGATAEEKPEAVKRHRYSEQKLREAVDELTKREGV